jgi:hypothetical protein
VKRRRLVSVIFRAADIQKWKYRNSKPPKSKAKSKSLYDKERPNKVKNAANFQAENNTFGRPDLLQRRPAPG